MQVKTQWLTVTLCLAVLTEHTVQDHHWMGVGLESASHKVVHTPGVVYWLELEDWVVVIGHLTSY